jgi:SAM-dependent MidA family methyltransferase
MTNQLLNIITETINNHPQKQITFAEYMELVLYQPQYGYYSSGKVNIGYQGDFFTSSSLGADFGELLAEQFKEMWYLLGCPQPFNLVEIGAGSGRLANDIIEYLEQQEPDLVQVLEYIIIEQAPGLIKQQQDLLEKWLDKGVNLCWKTWEEIEDHSLVGCCFSNELIDAFPVHQITVQNQEIKEIYVTLVDDQLTEVIGEISTEKIIDYFQLLNLEFPSKLHPEGYRTEVNLVALDWLKTVSHKLKRGYLLTIDYGYTAAKYYHPQRYQGTLQCYFQHHRHHNPYINIGSQDITTHVNFTALEVQGELLGLTKIGFTQQGLFLMALGLGDRLAALSDGKFSLQDILYRRDALHQLIEPQGLGGFGVLIQGKGSVDQLSVISHQSSVIM